MATKKTKTQMTRDYLRKHGSITIQESKKFGLDRLSSVIQNLEKDGWVFSFPRVTLTDDFGYTSSKYVRYTVVEFPFELNN